jgi:hypothetical protein
MALRLLIYGISGTPIFEIGERLAQFHQLDYFTIEHVPEEHDSYFDDTKIPSVDFDTGDFTNGSESKHMVRDPGSLKLDKEIENADPNVPDSESSDELNSDEINCIYDMKQGIVVTQIPDRDLIDWATHMLFLDGDEKEIINWFSKRRHCPICKAVYHMEEKVPLVSHRCDRCGGDLIQKNEDMAEDIQQEFKSWRNAFWAFEEMAKHQHKYKRLDIEKVKDFSDLCSRVNLWTRKHIEVIPINWWEQANLG